MLKLLTIFVAAVFTQNMALTYLLGMCPFISLSRRMKTAFGMGVAVNFVIILTVAVNWPIMKFLQAHNSEIISYLVFIVVIAATVQLVEMLMEKFFPALQAAFGIFLPLITVNCVVLAVSIFMQNQDYTYMQAIIFGFGSAAGWMLAIVMVAAINEKLVLTGDIPKGLRGPGIVMIIAGIIALAFLGFGGIVSTS